MDEYFLAMAETAALRAECTRRKVGVIVVKDGVIVGHGYNGSLPGAPSCLDGACPRGRASYEEIQAMTDYANCIATHAERNAMMNTVPANRTGSTVYINHEPCPACQTLLTSLSVSRVVFPTGEWTP